MLAEDSGCVLWQAGVGILLNGSDSKMKIAAFTMVHNEAVFLPLWRQYYGHTFGEVNLFVLDHGSTDDSLNNLGRTQLLNVPMSKYYDEDERAAFVGRCQSVLLRYYDAVVFSDADEFLIPDPDAFDGLADFIIRHPALVLAAIGLELSHLPDEEPDIDLARPILAQRNYVRYAASYCKPLVTRTPVRWSPGFHSCNHSVVPDPSLFLFHLKRMDFKLASQRLQLTRMLAWSQNALAKRHGDHHRLQDDEFVSKIFPLTPARVNELLVPGFGFSSDIAASQVGAPDEYNPYEGSVARVPSRFALPIPGIEPERTVEADIAPALVRTGLKARQALRRTIILKGLRDHCRPAVRHARRLFSRSSDRSHAR